MTNRVRSQQQQSQGCWKTNGHEVIKVERDEPRAVSGRNKETSVLILLKPPKDLGISGNRVPLEAGVEPDAKNGKNG